MKETRLVAAIGVAALLAAACTTQTSEPVKVESDAKQLSGTIAFLAPNQTVVRWSQFDLPAMKKSLGSLAPGMDIKLYNAQDDATKQVQQAEAAITGGAKAIIMTAADPDQTAAITAKAHDAGIPIVAYAHEANNSDPDYYVTVPFEQIGAESAKALVTTMKPRQQKIRLAKIYGDPAFFFYSEQAKGHDKVLKQYVDAGDINVVCEADSIGYDTSNARRAMEQCLTRVGDKVDAVLVTNDSTANGVIAALANDGLAGKVKVFGGYDAEAGTIQQLLAGNISTDMRPPYDKMGNAAIEILVAELTGKKPDSALVNGTYNNKKKDVPTAFLPNVLITPDNIQQTLIDPGILSRKELCSGGPAVATSFCKG
ncbi:substrate-binding domain-containing protein [Kribbella sp. NPDC050124]|uniref:substrate-binding domain-containing protein n=1 Tax=Kribbella sp. NPDC050124 TaxID=3364114 RepID=UPI003787911F